MSEKTIKPVAVIRTDFKEKFGIPRQSGRCPSAKGEIIFEAEFSNADFIRGIEKFSHLWLIFGFSQCEREKICATVRPPRLGGNERVGVFASRAPYRPNGLGLSCVKLEKVIADGKTLALVVSGVDVLDGTPVYDVKPYIPSADKKTDAFGGYSEDFTAYKLNVNFPETLRAEFSEREYAVLTECLADDPRPSYQEDGRVYGMSFAGAEIKFSVKGDLLTVLSVNKD